LGYRQWSKSMGTNHNDVGQAINIATDGGYFLTGYSNFNLTNGYDGCLVKTDATGNVQFTKYYGGSDWDFLYNACLMPDGGLVMCGETYTDSKGGSDAYLIRTDQNGDTLWTKKIGTTGDDSFYAVAQKNNRIYVVGKTHNISTNKSEASVYKVDFSGNIISQNFYGPNSTDNYEYKNVYPTSGGDLLVCGKRQTPSNPFYVLRKLDTTNYVELNSATSTQNFHFNGVLEGNNNDVYTIGPGDGGLGGTSALFFRFSSAFIFMNAAHFGDTKDEEGMKMIRTSKGYAFVGWTKSYGNQNGSVNENVYLVVFNRSDLVDNYFLIKNEFEDTLSMVGLKDLASGLRKSKLYPHPLRSVSCIAFEDNEFENKQVELLIYDIRGVVVRKETLHVTNGKISVSRKDLESGLYAYQLKSLSRIITTGKLFVE
ncbi:MAG: hypothetical protein K0S12_1673, partial [Bacteroidetes bacterium]|nr:hypothetical protein [Bacteroidota bacterium]